MATYKTLVIAPSNPDLGYSGDEVMSVVNALGAKMLADKRATLTGLVDVLSQSWNIVWFSTHGDDTGIYLTDGPVITSELTTLVRSAGARLVVFNTCSSYGVAHKIHDEVRCDFVCTVRQLPDRQAFVTGTIFANQIANGMDFYDAYEIAKPGQNSTYVFLGAKGPPMQYDRPPRGSGEVYDLNQVSELVRQLQIIVRGNEQWNVEGVVPALRRVETKVDTLTNKVDQLEANQIFNRRLLITLSALAVFLMIAVGILLAMQAGTA